jgi:hypothetical protein
MAVLYKKGRNPDQSRRTSESNSSSVSQGLRSPPRCGRGRFLMWSGVAVGLRVVTAIAGLRWAAAPSSASGVGAHEASELPDHQGKGIAPTPLVATASPAIAACPPISIECSLVSNPGRWPDTRS